MVMYGMSSSTFAPLAAKDGNQSMITNLDPLTLGDIKELLKSIKTSNIHK